MVTTMILGVGITLIYRGLLLSMAYQTRLVQRLYANNLLNHKIDSDQQFFSQTGKLPEEKADPIEAVLNNKPLLFQFSTQFQKFEHLEELYQATILLHWQDNGQDYRLTRAVYLGKAKKLEESKTP